MNCRECQEYLQSQLDERRASLAREHVAEHLSACKPCRDFYKLSESSWTGDVVSPFHEAPDGFAERVLKHAATYRGRRDRTWYSLALALTLLLPIGLAFLAILADSFPGAARLADRSLENRPAEAQAKLDRLRHESIKLKEWSKDGIKYTVNLAERATESAARLVPDLRTVAPKLTDPAAILKPVRHVSVSLSESLAPVSQTAETAYQKLIQEWLPRSAPKPPSPELPPA
jgi:hypothetical protein